MYHPGKTQANQTFAGLQRTFYPKHCHYNGDGSGRDLQVTINNGGLNHVDKRGMMGHVGVHFPRYNSNVQRKSSSSPSKEATTFYYQSDGTGRDSYVLKNNGGLRPEYNIRASGDRIFRDSLRADQQSPIKHFKDPISDRADITSYLNWPSAHGKQLQQLQSQIQKDLISRLTKGSPEREITINYVLGQGKIGQEKRLSVSSYQGYKQSYDKQALQNSNRNHYKEQNDNKNNICQAAQPKLYSNMIRNNKEDGILAGELEVNVLKKALSRLRKRQASNIIKNQSYGLQFKSDIEIDSARENQAKTSQEPKRVEAKSVLLSKLIEKNKTIDQDYVQNTINHNYNSFMKVDNPQSSIFKDNKQISQTIEIENVNPRNIISIAQKRKSLDLYHLKKNLLLPNEKNFHTINDKNYSKIMDKSRQVNIISNHFPELKNKEFKSFGNSKLETYGEDKKNQQQTNMGQIDDGPNSLRAVTVPTFSQNRKSIPKQYIFNNKRKTLKMSFINEQDQE